MFSKIRNVIGLIVVLFGVLSAVTNVLSAKQSVERSHLTVGYTSDFTVEQAESVANLLDSPAIYGGNRTNGKHVRFDLSKEEGLIRITSDVRAGVDRESPLVQTLPLYGRVVSDHCFQGASVAFILNRPDGIPMLIAAGDLSRQSKLSGKDILLYNDQITDPDAIIGRLVRAMTFGANGNFAQVNRDGDQFHLRLIGDTNVIGALSDEERNQVIRESAVMARERLSFGYATTVEFCNLGLSPIDDWSASVPASLPATEIYCDGETEVQYNAGLSAEFAKAVAERISSGIASGGVIRLCQAANGEIECLVPLAVDESNNPTACHIAREILSALPESVTRLTCRQVNNSYQPVDTFDVTKRNGDFRAVLGDNRIFFTPEIDSQILDRLENCLIEMEVFDEDSFGLVYVREVKGGYAVSWQTTEDQVSDLEDSLAWMADTLSSTVFPGVPMQLEACDPHSEIIGTNVWFRLGDAAEVN